jgi:hypothetical protein
MKYLSCINHKKNPPHGNVSVRMGGFCFTNRGISKLERINQMRQSLYLPEY